ncbi:MAG TPA: dihydrolipoyl dehydrogenase, partial [Myxococcales bacterium]|nr:dihydrolipoyl dehydrogenase [Myxococcales bacterium]
CIPSKALIAAANTYQDMQEGVGTMGISTGDVSIDIDKLQDWKEGIVKKLTTGVQGLLKTNKADSVMGTAKLVAKNKVEVTDADGGKTTYEATKGIIIATGAQVIQIPGMEIDGETIISAR